MRSATFRNARPAASTVAPYLIDYPHEHPLMYQEIIVREIAKRFGEDFTSRNPNGNPAIRKDGFDAFNRMTKDDVVWAKSSRFWRTRLERDGPGRQVPE